MTQPLELIWINRPFAHAGHYMRPHSHSCFQLYYYLSVNNGKVFHLNDRLVDTQRGCAILIPPNVPHFTEPSGSDTMTYELKLMVHDSFLLKHLSDCPAPLYDEGYSEKIFEYIFANWLSHDPTTIQNITTLLHAFLLRFCISEEQEVFQGSHFIDTTGYSPVIRKTIAYLEQYFSNSFSLDDLSAGIHYNKSYLCTAFRRETGYSIIDYLTFVRIRNAVICFIFYGDTVSSVRESSGFTTGVHFDRVFKNCLGVTPSAFRSVFYALPPQEASGLFPDNPLVQYHICALNEAMEALRSIGAKVRARIRSSV